MKKTNKKGFTIVELVIVIAVIGILSAVLIPTFSGLIEKAKYTNDTEVCTNMRTSLLIEYDVEIPANIVEVQHTLKEEYANDFVPKTSNLHYYWCELDNYVYLVDDSDDGFDVKYPDTETKASVTSSNSYRLDLKANQNTPLPTIDSSVVTNNSIVLTISSTTGHGNAKYAIDKTTVAPTDASDWQDTATFNELEVNTEYHIFVKYAGDEDYNESPAAELTSVTTLKNSQAQAPTPTVTSAKITATSVKLTAIATNDSTHGEAQYACNIVDSVPESGWVTGLTFTGLNPNTDYYFFARYAGDETYNVSPVSEGAYVKTLKGDISYTAPTAVTDLIYENVDKALITEGSFTTENCTMLYALGTSTLAGEYSSTIPQAKNAGTYYVWYKVTGNENYNDVEEKIEVTIGKATYSMTDAKWSDTKEFTYDGNEKTVSVTGLPSGVTVNIYTDNSKTDAGNYTASVTFNYDTTNYNAPTLADCSWTINKATQTAPSAPTKASATSTTVTLNAVSAGQGDTMYGWSTENDSSKVTNWKTELTFEGLTPNTTYYFFAEYVGNGNYNEAVSASTEITTPAAITWSPLSATITTTAGQETVNYLPVFADNDVPENITFAYKDGEAYITIENPTMSSLATYANAGTLYYSGSGTLVTVRSVNDISWNNTFKSDSGSYPYYASTAYNDLQAGIKEKIATNGSETVEKVAMETTGDPSTTPTINEVSIIDIYNAYANESSGFGGSNGTFWSCVAKSSSIAYTYSCSMGGMWNSSYRTNQSDICVLISRTFN